MVVHKKMAKNKITIDKKTEFIKKNNRYLLSPEERVLKILKKEKEVSLSPLSNRTGIQYDILHIILKKLSSEGRCVIITGKLNNRILYKIARFKK